MNSVEKKSHPSAATRSFKVTVQTLDDFEKLMSGDYIPKCVKVKKFIHFKHSSSAKKVEGVSLDMPMDLSSFMNHPRSSDTRTPSQTQMNSLATSSLVISNHNVDSLLKLK